MGVPAFFRWLVKKYPQILADMLEEEPATVGGVSVPIDLTLPNPNGQDFDNLYLDMNGIIHPCVHPEDVPAPETEDEMFANICLYIDRLMAVVRPRKVLFMAIDGVAPRAKMNQQRSRRFKAAKEIGEQEDVEDRLRREMVEQGHRFTKSGASKKKVFDHNVITPGTTFMARLAARLRHYVHHRLTKSPGWRGLKVILSDSSVPGEGEHKIMEYVRAQRAQPGYDADTRHVLHGLDADLIMLGLATHEAHFHILREVMETRRRGPRGAPPPPTKIFRDGDAGISMKPLQLLHISALREYLQLEFAGLALPTALPFPFDLERVIDDFIFMCFFVGNDFLPHLPSLDIREGALDLILLLYKQLLPVLDGYLTDAGTVSLERVDVLLARIGVVEDQIFQMRRQRQVADKQDRVRREGYAGGGRGRGRGRGRGGGGAHASAGRGRRPLLTKAPERLGERGGRFMAQAAASGELELFNPSDEAAIAGAAARAKGGAASASARAWASSARAAAGHDASGPVGRTLLPDEASSGADDAAKVKARLAESNRSAAAALRSKLFGRSAKRSRAGEDAGGEAADAEDGGDADGAAAEEAEAEPADAASAKRAKETEEDDASAGAPADAEADADEQDGEAEEDSAEEDEEDEEEEEEDEEEDDDDDMDEESRLALEASAGELKDAVKEALKSKRELDEAPDDVRFGEDGFKERYYTSKFGERRGRDPAFLESVHRAYVEGLLWVFHYYYKGVASWRWYYPQHYAPFASDLKDIARFGIDAWELGTPFRPIEQLMGVLPPRSAHALPEACLALMTEPSSSVIDFYPSDFLEDPNGHRFAWQFVALLPFVDEARLVAAVESVEATFTDEEKRRNRHGQSLLFAHSSSRVASIAAPVIPRLGEAMPTIEDDGVDVEAAAEEALAAAPPAAPAGSAPSAAPGSNIRVGTGRVTVVEFGCKDTDADGRGMAGRAVPDPDAVAVEDTASPPPGARADPVLNNQAVSARLLLPPSRPHVCAILPGVTPPPRRLPPGEQPGRAPRMGKFHWLNVSKLAQDHGQAARHHAHAAQAAAHLRGTALGAMGSALGGAVGFGGPPRGGGGGGYPRHFRPHPHQGFHPGHHQGHQHGPPRPQHGPPRPQHQHFHHQHGPPRGHPGWGRPPPQAGFHHGPGPRGPPQSGWGPPPPGMGGPGSFGVPPGGGGGWGHARVVHGRPGPRPRGGNAATDLAASFMGGALGGAPAPAVGPRPGQAKGAESLAGGRFNFRAVASKRRK